MLKPSCLAIDQITDQPVGGKAAGLAELLRLGLPVPPAFVIVNARRDEFPAQLAEQYQALGAGRVAVRSSALGEDGTIASFAGQYETVLDVSGLNALKKAITVCVDSLHSARADAYSAEQGGAAEAGMNVVVQQMISARSAGVLFTADPVSGRHDRLVIDAVEGLGEALMSGSQSSDHFELDSDNTVKHREIAGERAALEPAEIIALASAARRAAETLGHPLDLEWAIDHAGKLFWLQARPITTLGSDLSELNTDIAPGEVITRCNIGEMMPGAVSPLTFSVQGRAIEHGMQHMHLCWGARPAITRDWTQISYFFGHLFINMSGSLQAARQVGFSSADNIAQSLCGRPVPELPEPDEKAPWWRRQLGSAVFLRYCLRARRVTGEFEAQLKKLRLAYTDDAASMMRELERNFHWLCDTHEVHLRSSAYSGVMEGVIQGMVSRSQGSPGLAEQAEAARLLAGAENVESALLVAHLDEVVDQIARQGDALSAFGQATPAAALTWLQSPSAGAAQLRFRDFLSAHGHRGFRELCLREKAWIDEPEKLVVTMQAALASRLNGSYQPACSSPIERKDLTPPLRFLLPMAHDAIRQREHTKSLLVEVTHRLKRGYRHLGELLAREGHLADADLVFFLTHDELGAFCRCPDSRMAALALARREALAYQEKLEFEEVYVGRPEPRRWQAAEADQATGELSGRPVSRGVVEGTARVCLTLEQAAALQPGEILVAPVTDVGWTPYFSLIAGLATDVGSAVSHGAVIAREYGLPAIVNLRNATRVLQDGDRIRLDADRGRITVLNSEPSTASEAIS